jgi:hypothetical protein
MTLIRIFSVGFNGNNTIHYFTNNGLQILKQKLQHQKELVVEAMLNF